MAYEPLRGVPTFFERQGPAAGCGRHALNNFFGGVFFTATAAGPYTEEELIQAGKDLSGTPMDLTRVCKSLQKATIAGVASGGECPTNEDYDITTLSYALIIAGYGVDPIQKLPAAPKGLGYIINLGGTSERSGHWVSLRTDVSGLVFKDSLTAGSVQYATLAEFLAAKGASFVGKYQRILAITERSLENAQGAIILSKIDTIMEKLRKTIADEPQLSAIRHILVDLSLDQIVSIYANPDYKVDAGALRNYVATDLAIRGGTDVSEDAFKAYEKDKKAIIKSLSHENERSKKLTRLLRKTRNATDETELQGLLDEIDTSDSGIDLSGSSLDLSGSGHSARKTQPPRSPSPRPPPPPSSGLSASPAPPRSVSPQQGTYQSPKPSETKLSNLTNFFTNLRVPEKFTGIEPIERRTFDPTQVGSEIDFLDMHGLVTHVSDTKATVDPAAHVFYEKNGIFAARTVPDADEPWRLTQLWNWLNGTLPEKPSIGPEDHERLTKYLVLMKDVVLPRRIQKVSESMPGPDQAEINEMKSYIQYLETILRMMPSLQTPSLPTPSLPTPSLQTPSLPARSPPPKAVFTVYTTGLADDIVRKAWIDNGLTQKIRDAIKMQVVFKHYDPAFTANAQKDLDGECIKAHFTYKDFISPYLIIDCAHSYKYNPDKTKSRLDSAGTDIPETLSADVPILYLGYAGDKDSLFNKKFFEFTDHVTTYIDKLIDTNQLKDGTYPNDPTIIDTLWTK